MHDSEAERSSDATSRGERLDSWKEIATYLGKGVTTVQRWEQHEGLPVHRLPHAKKGSVFALRLELDAWRQTRAQLGPVRPNVVEEVPSTAESETALRWRRSPLRRRSLFAVILGAAAVTAVAMTRALRRTNPETVSAAASPVAPLPLVNDVADETCPSLSPDGTQVVYHWRRELEPGLYIKPVAGGPPHRLNTGDAGDVFECGYSKWSPTGDLIAFLTPGEAETKNIWVVSPTGGKARRLTSASGIGLAWAPDGQALAFVDRNSLGEPFSIFSVSLHGGQRTRLTSPPLGDFGDTFCAFSPDGARLAIVRYGARYQSDVFVTRVGKTESEGLERVTTALGGIEGIEWSPDGRAIVFGSHLGLWQVPVAGGGEKPRRVAAFDGGAKYPSFSRAAGHSSRQRLVYQSDIVDVNIWRWDLTRREAKKVAGSTWWEDFPAISPSGDRLAFASSRTGDNEIWTANADGSNPQRLTFHGGPVVASPQWSPDGDRLTFSSQVGDNRDIYVIRSDGSESNRITTAPSEEANPTWSRDGRWLYFRSDRAGIGQIWKKAPAAGGAPIRVTSGEALEAYESPDGKRLYFVRSADVPGLWMVPVNGGTETLVLPDVRYGFWAVVDRGIYYLTPATEGSAGRATLRFFDLSTAAVSTLASPPVSRRAHSGFAASRDGKFLYWTQVDNAINDLVLIDPWKP